MIEIARDSRLTVIGDRSRDCCDFQADRDWGQLWTPGLPGMGTTRSGFQADHHKIQKTTQNKENGAFSWGSRLWPLFGSWRTLFGSPTFYLWLLRSFGMGF